MYVYNYRLNLRCQRKFKKCCKNCIFSKEQILDLGQFGEYIRYICNNGFEEPRCKNFQCKYNLSDVQKQMLEDIKNPSVCGSKEPKIAALLWVLHDGNNKKETEQVSLRQVELQKKPSFLQKIKRIFVW